MLRELRLQGLGVIEEAVVPLGSGFTVVTGETGAGKTMLLQALRLVTGGKLDGSAVRRGSARAVAEATVVLGAADDAVGQRVADAGAELEDDGTVLAVRTLTLEGRSRAALGGVGVPAAVLADIVGSQVTVHGQHDQQRLLRPAEQRAALDRFAGPDVGSLLASYEKAWGRWLRARAELSGRQAAEGARRQEADLLRHGLERIASAAPAPGEDDALRREADVLGHADALRRAAEEALALLAGDDEGTVTALAVRARRALEEVAGHDPAVEEWVGRVREVAVLATELGTDIAARIDEFEADPVRLEHVGERRAALQELARVYTDERSGPGADGLLAWADSAVTRLAELDADRDTTGALENEVTGLGAELGALAQRLRTARAAAGVRLGAEVAAELHGLGMADARLAVHLSPLTQGGEVLDVDGGPSVAGPRGIDEVELQLAAHPGAPSGPLSRVASGGELSRVMLALELVFADVHDTSTLVFDEVDAGVGGRAAVEVGRRLARLARTHQIVVVTHLPQVAAFADHHLVVTKDLGGEVTTSGVHVVDGDGRRAELARMLAGDEASGSANEHAQELLDRARSELSSSH